MVIIRLNILLFIYYNCACISVKLNVSHIRIKYSYNIPCCLLFNLFLWFIWSVGISSVAFYSITIDATSLRLRLYGHLGVALLPFHLYRYSLATVSGSAALDTVEYINSNSHPYIALRAFPERNSCFQYRISSSPRSSRLQFSVLLLHRHICILEYGGMEQLAALPFCTSTL